MTTDVSPLHLVHIATGDAMACPSSSAISGQWILVPTSPRWHVLDRRPVLRRDGMASEPLHEDTRTRATVPARSLP